MDAQARIPDTAKISLRVLPEQMQCRVDQDERHGTERLERGTAHGYAYAVKFAESQRADVRSSAMRTACGS
jgi:hypothetical protein